MKFIVRNPEKGEFEIDDVRTAESKTRAFVARAVVLVGLALLIGGAVYAMISRDTVAVRWIVATGATMVGTVLGYYFAKSK
jgi:hypothetical protein